MTGVLGYSGISWTIALRSRLTTTPTRHHLTFTGRMLFLMPNQQRQPLKGKCNYTRSSQAEDTITQNEQKIYIIIDKLSNKQQHKK